MEEEEDGAEERRQQEGNAAELAPCKRAPCGRLPALDGGLERTPPRGRVMTSDSLGRLVLLRRLAPRDLAGRGHVLGGGGGSVEGEMASDRQVSA